MNTIVKIKSCKRITANAKILYNETRTKAMEKDITVLIASQVPEPQELNSDHKKIVKNLQTKLSKYRERLSIAEIENKPKSIKTNSKNIEKIEAELAEVAGKNDDRKKHFVEFTVALTNSKNEIFDKEWGLKTVAFFKRKFPEMTCISAVEHHDQASPHLHLMFHSPKKKITQVLSEKYTNGKTNRESMKWTYGHLARDYNAFANREIGKMSGLERGRKYVNLGAYKLHGNWEVKRKAEVAENQTKEPQKSLKIDFYSQVLAEVKKAENEVLLRQEMAEVEKIKEEKEVEDDRRRCEGVCEVRSGGTDERFAGAVGEFGDTVGKCLKRIEQERDERDILERLGNALNRARSIFEGALEYVGLLRRIGDSGRTIEEQRISDGVFAKNLAKREKNKASRKSPTPFSSDFQKKRP